MKRVNKRTRSLSALAGLLILVLLYVIGRYWYAPAEQALAADITDGLSVSYLDVGQGDSILIRTVNGQFVLIDAGPNDSEAALKADLDAAGVKTIAYAIFTHPHEDHIGGGDIVISDYTVEHVLMSDAYSGTATYEKLLTAIDEKQVDTIMALPDFTFSVDGADFTVLAPDNTDVDNLNNASVVLRMVYGKTSFLFTGDAESSLEKEILNNYNADALQSDVLKLGHHGSSSSSSPTFLDAVSPRTAIISCAKENDYGHPHKETLQALTERKLPVYRTDENGSVFVYSDGTDISVKTQKD